MVFELEETLNEELGRKVCGIFGDICALDKPTVSDCFRLGTVKPGTFRPVKVLFLSREAAAKVLKSPSGPKEHAITGYTLYITPD